MEPIWGFILFICGLVIVCIIARKRGRPMWPYIVFTPLAAAAMVPVVARISGSAIAAGFGAFVPLAAAFVASLASSSGSQLAAERGSYRGMKKCPHCAEPVKAEAIKCKHCGEKLEAVAQ